MQDSPVLESVDDLFLAVTTILRHPGALQDPPESYALQRAPQAPIQLSFVEALKGKDVISAAEGARLGVAAGAILDAAAMTLEAITLSDTAAPTARGEPPFCVPTATLTQVCPTHSGTGIDSNVRRQLHTHAWCRWATSSWLRRSAQCGARRPCRSLFRCWACTYAPPAARTSAG